jgi:hypothetical protein
MPTRGEAASPRRGRWWPCGVLVELLILGCSSTSASMPVPESSDPDVVRPPPGGALLEGLPGGLLGPYGSYSDALIAACDKILQKPHATAGRRDHLQFDVRWRVSSEYCAWMYYTPDGKYRVSKLTDQTKVDPALRDKKCFLPSLVEDPHYPQESIKYVFGLHNHLFDDRVSDDDIRFIIGEGGKHAFEIDTKDGKVRLSIVAYFANDFENPKCDGFYQYIPATNQIVKWTQVKGMWRCSQTHLVIWSEDLSIMNVQEAVAPCKKESGL